MSIRKAGLCAAALVLFAWNTGARAAGGAYEVDSSATFELDVYLTAGTLVRFETGNTSAGADPYLRVLRLSGNTVTEVARNDNGAGAPNARVQFTPAVSSYHKLIVHSASPGAAGTTTVYMNSSPLYVNAQVGGSFLTLPSLQASETITTLALARGPTIHNVYVLSSAGQLIQVQQSGANEATRRTITAPAMQTLVISGFSGAGVSPTRRIRVVVNDAAISGHDSDGDGLGNELEASIGTCSNLSQIAGGNFECSRATDARDTDGDGLSDSEELLGQIDRAPYQLLPRWGANPRHKDIFVEVDYNARNQGEADYRMSPATARAVARTFAYPGTDALRRLANAQSLVNPDLEAGIRIHLDTGVNPMPGSLELDFTTYGNWGGHSYVPPVCSGGTCAGAQAESVWPTYLSPGRHGLFHYALGFIGASGSADPHQFAENLPIGGPTIDAAVGAAAFAHEFGHTLGLGHSAPDHAEGEIDPNCKPNFPSLMNYGYRNNLAGTLFADFSDGYGRGNLNNASLQEVQGITVTSAESQRYMQQLRDFFGYYVRTSDGSVDWNRDGVLSLRPVRAYSNNNGICEWTRYSKMNVSGAKTSVSPAVVRAGSTTAAFYLRTDKRLAYTRTTSDFNCAVAANGCGAPFSAPQIVSGSWNTDIDAFDVHRINQFGFPRFLIVYRKGSTLYEVVLTTSFTPGQPVTLPTIIDAMDEFSLAGTNQRVFLMYKSYASMPYFMERSGSTWTAPEFVITSDGEYITNIASESSPALLYVTANDGTQTLYGVFPRSVSGTEGRMTLYTFDFTSRRWQPSWVLPGEATVGRPAMAAVPMDDADALFKTRLYVVWLRRSATGNTVIRQTMLVAASVPFPVGSFETRFQPASDHDNSWARGRGVDLMFEPGVDSNLRALIAPSDIGANGIELLDLQLRPRADGISDYVFRNYDEWEYMGIDLCRTLDRFTCKEWPF